MALSDPTQMITTELNDISYTAGQEPWNKNLGQYTFDNIDTEVNTYTPDFSKWHGIYRTIPEARSTLDVWCSWVIGKKLTMDEKTRKITDRIRGNGNDTFRIILKNQKRTAKICGDSFAEQVRDKANRLINLKPLNPGHLRIVSNGFGIITKYEQVSNINAADLKILQSWEPHEIFHISNDRIADEIHGIPELEKTFNIMKWKHQSMGDLATMFHRYVQPILEIYASTDDPVELASIEKTYTSSRKNFENRIIPKGAIEKVERVAIPQFATLDPLPWQKFLRSYWTETSNVPDLIRGKSDEVSLAAGKLNYLGYKEKIIMEQLEYSEEIKAQLGLDISFEEPKEIDIDQGFNKSNETD
ncbi:hypothetical protein LCGC14_1990320 [marine sediment metagenome]|uniref:Phage portal protein n=1 Tax=marine sediment metagenome TaxID=412755 RepID=A0A0F9F639_9ZZZZ